MARSFKDIKAIPAGTSPRHGDMLVGYVFDITDIPDWTSAQRADRPFRWHNTVKVMPLAGPIFFQDCPDSPWARYFAKCVGCGGYSKHYPKRTSRIRTWALRHRCKIRNEFRYLLNRD